MENVGKVANFNLMKQKAPNMKYLKNIQPQVDFNVKLKYFMII